MYYLGIIIGWLALAVAVALLNAWVVMLLLSSYIPSFSYGDFLHWTLAISIAAGGSSWAASRSSS